MSSFSSSFSLQGLGRSICSSLNVSFSRVDPVFLPPPPEVYNSKLFLEVSFRVLCKVALSDFADVRLVFHLWQRRLSMSFLICLLCILETSSPWLDRDRQQGVEVEELRVNNQRLRTHGHSWISNYCDRAERAC